MLYPRFIRVLEDMSVESPETFTDAEVRKIARSIFARPPCKGTFRPSREVLDFVERPREQVLHGRGWTGRSGPTDHNGYETLLDIAAEHGRFNPATGGVHVRVSVRDFALHMGTSRTTANKSLLRQQEAQLLYRNPRVTNGEAGELVLRNIATQELDNLSTGLDTPLSVQGLRTLLRRTRYGAGRLGKLPVLALRAVLLCGGEATTQEVASRLERRGCDVRRTLR